MLRALRAVRGTRWLPLRPHALVCVPAGATKMERRSGPAAGNSCIPHCVVPLVDEPVAAGAGVDVSGGEGVFVVDVGGGTPQVAVVAGGRVVRAKSLSASRIETSTDIAITVVDDPLRCALHGAAAILENTNGTVASGSPH